MHGSETGHVLHITCHTGRQKKVWMHKLPCLLRQHVAYLSTCQTRDCRQGYKLMEASSPAHAPARVGAGRPGMLGLVEGFSLAKLADVSSAPGSPAPRSRGLLGGLCAWLHRRVAGVSRPGMQTHAQHADACPKKRGAYTSMALTATATCTIEIASGAARADLRVH